MTVWLYAQFNDRRHLLYSSAPEEQLFCGAIFAQRAVKLIHWVFVSRRSSTMKATAAAWMATTSWARRTVIQSLRRRCPAVGRPPSQLISIDIRQSGARHVEDRATLLRRNAVGRQRHQFIHSTMTTTTTDRHVSDEAKNSYAQPNAEPSRRPHSERISEEQYIFLIFLTLPFRANFHPLYVNWPFCPSAFWHCWFGKKTIQLFTQTLLSLTL